MYIYIYIYIERERERDICTYIQMYIFISMVICIYVYFFIYKQIVHVCIQFVYVLPPLVCTRDVFLCLGLKEYPKRNQFTLEHLYKYQLVSL